MPITLRALTSGGQTTASKSITTASVTPGANKLILLSVTIEAGSTSYAEGYAISASGCNLTWEAVDRVASYPDGTTGNYWVHTTLFRAMSSNPLSGQVTITVPGVDASCMAYSMVELDGVDRSGTNGSGAVRQTAKNRGQDTSSVAVTLAAFGHADNATFSTVGYSEYNGESRSMEPGAGFTEIHDGWFKWACNQTQWQAANDTTVDSNATGSAWVLWGCIGAEIVANQTTTTTGSFSWTETDDTTSITGLAGDTVVAPPAATPYDNYLVTGGSADLIYSNVPENDHPEYNSSVTYSLNARVIDKVRHKVYMSIADANLGNPVTDTTKWLDVGRTNRWKLHDTSIQSRTTNPGVIHKQYRVRGVCSTVAALNLNATQMVVKVFDNVKGEIYNRSETLVAGSAIANWYDYFFNPISLYATDKVFNDLPKQPNVIVDVVIISNSGQAACGELILGQTIKVGYTQYGAKIGITDYSVKTQDQFGNYTVTERPYRKTADFQVMVDNSTIDNLQTTLAKYRATPVLYLGSDSYSATTIYGFYRGFDITISYPTAALCSISLEGLT